MIPSRHPSIGILDQVASASDLDLMIALEGLTNDRLRTEAQNLHRLPKSEWVLGKPFASVIMAAFCHARPSGGRFNSRDRGAWYASRNLETSQAEIAYHRTKELAEVGVFETFVQMRAYYSDFVGEVYDIRLEKAENEPYHHPDNYSDSQALASEALADGGDGIAYRSVRHQTGECLACFRPKLVENVRPGSFYEFRWEGFPTPRIRTLRTGATA